MEILQGIFDSIKYERFSKQEENKSTEQQKYLNEIQVCLSIQTVTQEMNKILLEYYNMDILKEQDLVNLTIDIQSNNNCVQIKYQFPQTQEDIDYIEHIWYCPALFSIFSQQDFFKILTAVLLERSLVFVSDFLPILSSAILSLKTLIKPFQWCYALIPILPSALLDILDAPQPILVGISSLDYETMNLTESEKACKTWVFLDQNKIEWGQYDTDFQDEYKNNKLMKWSNYLYKETQNLFQKFYNQVSSSTILEFNKFTQKSESIASIEDQGIIIIPNNNQIIACRKICKQIQIYLLQLILSNISFKDSNNQETKDIQIQFDFKYCKAEEREFLLNFIQTQMFVTQIEDNKNTLFYFLYDENQQKQI